jgi:hypothetical protein
MDLMGFVPVGCWGGRRRELGMDQSYVSSCRADMGEADMGLFLEYFSNMRQI